MKIRTSFVTNSSSSSFLIAIKKDKFKNPATLFEKFAVEYLKASDNFDCSCEVLEKKRDVAKKFVERYAWNFENRDDYDDTDSMPDVDLEKGLKQAREEGPYTNNLIDRCLKAIEEGYIVIDREVSTHASEIRNILHNLPSTLGEDIVMLGEED